MKKSLIIFLILLIWSHGLSTQAAESLDVNAAHAVFGKRLVEISPPSYAVGGMINADGTRIILTEKAGGIFTLWDAQSGDRIERYDRDSASGSFYNLTIFSPDGKRAYIPSLAITTHHTPTAENLIPAVDVIDATSGDKLQSVAGPEWPKPCQNSAEKLAVSRDGGRLAALLCFDNVAVYDTATWKILSMQQEDTGAPPYRIALNPDGSLLAMGYVDGKVELRDAMSGKIVRTIQAQLEAIGGTHTYSGSITTLFFSADGSRLYTATKGVGLSDASRLKAFIADTDAPSIKADNESARVWDVASGQLIATYAFGVVYHEDTYMALSPDERTVIVAKSFRFRDNPAHSTLAAFDVRTRQIIDTLDLSPEGIKDISLAGDGKTLCVVGDEKTFTLEIKDRNGATP